jgi:hypothetical protein
MRKDQNFPYLPGAFLLKEKEFKLSIYQFRCDTFKEYTRMQRFLSQNKSVEEKVPDIINNLQLYPVRSNQIIKGNSKRRQKKIRIRIPRKILNLLQINRKLTTDK